MENAWTAGTSEAAMCDYAERVVKGRNSALEHLAAQAILVVGI